MKPEITLIPIVNKLIDNLKLIIVGDDYHTNIGANVKFGSALPLSSDGINLLLLDSPKDEQTNALTYFRSFLADISLSGEDVAFTTIKAEADVLKVLGADQILGGLALSLDFDLQGPRYNHFGEKVSHSSIKITVQYRIEGNNNFEV